MVLVFLVCVPVCPCMCLYVCVCVCVCAHTCVYVPHVGYSFKACTISMESYW